MRSKDTFVRSCCAKLHAMGIRVLLLAWDNASWHLSHEVRSWIRQHNRQVKRSGEGVRILARLLPIKSPWLNPIEPKWVHGKRRVVEPNRSGSVRAGPGRPDVLPLSAVTRSI